MISDGDVNGIGGAAIRHVGGHAVFGCVMVFYARVASPASLEGSCVVLFRFMRIMAGGAGNGVFAVAETRGLEEPTRAAREFEFVVISFAGRVVEVQGIVRKRF